MVRQVAGKILPLMRPFPLFVRGGGKTSEQRGASSIKKNKRLLKNPKFQQSNPDPRTLNLMSSSEDEQDDEEQEEKEEEEPEAEEEEEEEAEPKDPDAIDVDDVYFDCYADQQQEEPEDGHDADEQQSHARDCVAPRHLDMGGYAPGCESYNSDDNVLTGMTVGVNSQHQNMPLQNDSAPVIPQQVYNCTSVIQTHFYKPPDSNPNLHRNLTEQERYEQQVEYVFVNFFQKFIPQIYEIIMYSAIIERIWQEQDVLLSRRPDVAYILPFLVDVLILPP